MINKAMDVDLNLKNYASRLKSGNHPTFTREPYYIEFSPIDHDPQYTMNHLAWIEFSFPQKLSYRSWVIWPMYYHQDPLLFSRLITIETENCLTHESSTSVSLPKRIRMLPTVLEGLNQIHFTCPSLFPWTSGDPSVYLSLISCNLCISNEPDFLQQSNACI